MGKPTICISENKLRTQISFATRIVQFLFYLNPKFQASSSFLCLYRLVCVRPVRKPHCWFSHEVALCSIIFRCTGIKVGLSLLTTPSIKPLKAKLVPNPSSLCKQHRIKSDTYWECLIRNLAVGAGQITSTCSMGSGSNQNSVVDSHLR